MHDAVLTDHAVIRCDMPDRPLAYTPDPAETPFEQLEHVAGAFSLENIWVHPESRWYDRSAREQTRDGAPQGTYVHTAPRKDERGEVYDQIQSIRPHFRGDGREYAIVYTSDLWAFCWLEAHEMARTIREVTAALNLKHLEPTPAGTGIGMLQASLRERKLYDVLDYAVPDEERGRYNGADILWGRAIGETGAYAWGYDTNSAYLACAANSDFGIAAPLATSTFQRGLPGFYLVSATPGASTWNGADLPSPFAGNDHHQVQGWYAESLVRFALDHGWDVAIHEGVYWPKDRKRRMLTDWTDRMWAARMNTGGAARACVKAMMTGGIGRLRNGAYRKTNRPDWNALIISESRARRLRHIEKFAREYGHTPFAVQTDGLYYASDDPIAIPLADTLGGYKSAGCYRLSDETRADGPVNARIALLKKEPVSCQD